MKKIVDNQSGITLVEVLVATILLGFIVSVYVILSGSIVKTNTESGKDSQAMAFATIISELIKNEYKLDSKDNKLTLESTVIDRGSTPDGNPNYSIRQQLSIPSTGFEDITYQSGKKTGYQYCIKIFRDKDSGRYLEIKVTVRNVETKTEETLIFRHNFLQ